MNVSDLRVRNYRSLEDTGWVDIDELTCLVGRNESGKTAFMRAVQQLNPAYSEGEYAPYAEYPRTEWAEYSETHEEQPAVVASGRFELDPDDVDAVEEAFVPGLLTDTAVVVHRDYANEFHWEIPIDERAAIDYLLETYEFADDVRSTLREARSLSQLDGDARLAVESHLDTDPLDALADTVGAEVLGDRLPTFHFVGEYSVMSGTIDVDSMLERRETGELDAGDRVFLSLLSVAGLELDDLEEVGDWRQTTTRLESASKTVSDAAMGYWSQSGNIRIRIEHAQEDEGTVLEVRVENPEYGVTVEFEQRSHGFRRFFSTFCQLSAFRQSQDNVLLLDEPGLNLHARAKQEFLEFLKTEVAPANTTIYTAHSPFLIDKENLHRVRMVLDEPVGDENIVSDVSAADEYTRFPLRNVFEFDLMDTLLVHPQALLVERKADHIYLYVLSQFLRDTDKTGLNGRWTVIPIQNDRNVRSFVSLFGGDRLDVAALLRDQPAWLQSRRGRDDVPADLADIPVKLVSEYADIDSGATLEDILSREFYLELVNGAYATEIVTASGVPDQLTTDELDGSGPVVEQLRAYFQQHGINDGEFDRAEPALYLQDNRAELAADLDNESRRAFTRLFTDLDNVLESFEGVQIREASFLGSLFG